MSMFTFEERLNGLGSRIILALTNPTMSNSFLIQSALVEMFVSTDSYLSNCGVYLYSAFIFFKYTCRILLLCCFVFNLCSYGLGVQERSLN